MGDKKRKTHTSSRTSSSKPSVVTDWRTEIKGEAHQGSFVWDDIDIIKPKQGLCECIRRKGKKAILKGPKMKLPNKISLIEYFNNQLEKFKIHQEYPAIIYGDDESECLTYQELDILSNALGNSLLSRIGPTCKNTNLDKDIIIAFIIPPSVRYIALIFATMKMGAGFFPISMDLPAEKIFNSINEVRPILTIVSKQKIVLDKLEELIYSEAFEMVMLEDLWESLDDPAVPLCPLPVPFIKSLGGDAPILDPVTHKHIQPPYPPLYQRTVAIISPSNAAGIFTGVRYKSRPIFNWITWEWKHFKMAPTEKMILQSDYDTVISLVEIFSPLLRGNCLVLLDTLATKHPVRILGKIQQLKIVRISIWPTILYSILRTVELIGVDVGRQFLETVKFWFCVGGTMTTEMGELFFALLPQGSNGARLLINMYGNDEDMGAVSYQIIDSAEHARRLNYRCQLPIGSPLPNVNIYVVDSNMKVVRGNEIGEICVAGKMLADNYSKSEASPNKLIKNPFSKSEDFQFLLRTGDFGRIVTGDYGQRYLVNELSRSLDRHAFLECRVVELDEIKLHLMDSKLMIDCHTMCYRPGYEDQIIIAFCCCKPNVFPKINDYLQTKVPNYMIPDLIEIDSIERNDDGTVNENHLLRYFYDVMIKRKDFDDWDSLGHLGAQKLHAVKVLFSAIFYLVGISYKELAELYKKKASFLEIPRTNYSKSVFVVRELHRSRFPITLGEFYNALTLDEIAYHMECAKVTRSVNYLDDELLRGETKYKIETMIDEQREEVSELLCRTLTSKGSIDYYSETRKSDLKKFILSMWVMFVVKKLSFVVKRNSDGKIIGAMINVNWHDEMNPGSVRMTLEVSYRFQLMHILEQGFGETNMSPLHTTCVQIVYATLDQMELNDIETHVLMERLIKETGSLAKRLNFDALLFTTFDYFVTDICVTNCGFKVIRECQVNQFVAADGTRPYFAAQDNLVATLCFKKND